MWQKREAWGLLEPLLVKLARLLLHILHQAKHLHSRAHPSRLKS